MISIISLILGSTTGLISLFFLMFIASYILIPGMGGILVSFGASALTIKGLLLLMVVVYFAAIIGDITIYFLTRRFSKQVLGFLRRFKWYHKNDKKTRKLLAKYGFWIVFFSRFIITEVCLVTNYVAGFTRFNSRKFILAVLTGELIYAIVLPLFGYLFKDTWNYLLSLIQESIWVLVIALLAGLLAKKIIRMMSIEKSH